MRRTLPFLTLLIAAGSAHANGLLIPAEKQLPPLAMLSHNVDIAIDDQVAVTRVEQTFRNHTDRQLEATYIFPVPKGASVRKFSMWVDGKEMPGELVEADKARQIYTEIVRRTQDPGLLEYMDNHLLRLRVFPVPAKGDQKIAFSFTSLALSDQRIVEYRYPLKTDGKATSTLKDFSIHVHLKSQYAVQNIYSPTHAVTISRPTDRAARVEFAKDQAVLDKDFQLFYTTGDKDVGLTALTHRPSGAGKGYFMMLVSPRAELSKVKQVPRDMVFVLDTSGSMRGKRIVQAQQALKYCLNNLQGQDRFALINFGTTVDNYADTFNDATPDNILQASRWVDRLEATGGTAINDALTAALKMRAEKQGRTFTIVFFTDGMPTIGETDPNKILKNILAKNTAGTRIFTFGVGDNVNAAMLDQLAEQSRAVVTYITEVEDIESKVSSLHSKISQPVLTDLKLTVDPHVKLAEVYPPQFPDLFHGTQLVVFGRYDGHGKAAVKLTGNIGTETREFAYETDFAEQSKEEKTFVEDLWARRKVGYLLDQIGQNGENKELVEEVVRLAKRYGITTPYTSYLIMPDAAVPVAGRAEGSSRPNVSFDLGGNGEVPPALQGPDNKSRPVVDFIKGAQPTSGLGGSTRLNLVRQSLESVPTAPALDSNIRALQQTREQFKLQLQNGMDLKNGNLWSLQNGGFGVGFNAGNNRLQWAGQVQPNAQRWIGSHATGSNTLQVGGVWIDEAYESKMKTVAVKAQSDAYFRILERQPQMRSVFSMGNYLVWVTPSRAALVIDANNGLEKMATEDIDRLFVAVEKKD